MGGCGFCGRGVKTVSATQPSSVYKATIQEKSKPVSNVVEKSTSDTKVKIRYYGGGYTQKRSSGCRSCGGGGSYSVVTNETIMFVSEDAPSGLFKETFSLGHDYYVTEKQAEFLLTLQFKSRAGTMENKFGKVE